MVFIFSHPDPQTDPAQHIDQITLSQMNGPGYEPQQQKKIWSALMKTVLIHCLLIIQFPFLLSGHCWANLFFFFFFSFSVCSPSDWGSQCCSAKLDWRGFMVYKDKKDRGGRECDTVWRQKNKKKKKIQNLHCVVLKSVSQFDYFFSSFPADRHFKHLIFFTSL